MSDHPVLRAHRKSFMVPTANHALATFWFDKLTGALNCFGYL
jgi:hypothetical protein